MTLIREYIAEDFYSLWKDAIKDYVRRGRSKSQSSLKELLIQWEWEHGKPKYIESLKKVVDYVLLHSSAENNYLTIKEVIIQAMFHGAGFVMSSPNDVCTKFLEMYDAVKRDIEQALQNARMINIDRTVALEIEAEHNIGIVLCDFFKDKFPQHRIIVIHGNKAHLYDDYYTEAKMKTKEDLFKIFQLDENSAIKVQTISL